MCSALDVAKYFLLKSDPEIGENISNLKLQKLLYFAQGFYLAFYNDSLFSARIEAWAHGPVVPEIYHRYKEFEGNAIPAPRNFDVSKITKKAQSLLDEIWTVYGQFSAWKLREITHGHIPWKNTPQGGIIDPVLMRQYFKTLIKAK